MQNESSSAVAVLQGWFSDHEGTFQSGGAVARFNVSRQGSGAVDIETRTHLYQIIAWDNAWCLDVQVIELASEKSSFPIVGPNTPTEFVENLEKFLRSSGLAASTAAT